MTLDLFGSDYFRVTSFGKISNLLSVSTHVSRGAFSCPPTHGRVRPQPGFTLIELLIVIALVAILASIALPSYQRYITKSRARSATADLVALSLVVENRFQSTLSYPSATKATTSATEAEFAGWSPSQKDHFMYKYTPTLPSGGSAATGYAVQASGTGSMTGCTLTLDSANDRTAGSQAACGFSAW